jgi:hypothetical protein
MSGSGVDPTPSVSRVESSVDRSGPRARLVVRDAERETVWVSVLESEACSLSEWR